jgi:GNAT superfamily N-acetyltransferase
MLDIKSEVLLEIDKAKASVSMPLIADCFWTLRIDPTPSIPLIPEEPQDFMYEVCGKILCGTEAEVDRIAGRFRVYYADFETALNYDVSAFEVLDAYQHTLEYAQAILGSNEGLFSARLQKLLEDDIWNLNLLILDRVEILPKYRGSGIGLLVLTSLIERFGGGAGVVGLKPFPLQLEPKQSRDSSAWAKRLRLDDLPRDAKMATEKLKRYYEKLGFVRMKSTPFMFRSMSWAFPSVEQLRSK